VLPQRDFELVTGHHRFHRERQEPDRKALAKAIAACGAGDVLLVTKLGV